MALMFISSLLLMLASSAYSFAPESIILALKAQSRTAYDRCNGSRVPRLSDGSQKLTGGALKAAKEATFGMG